MKIIEAINKLDELKVNSYKADQKIRWLSRVDWMVKRLILDTHLGEEIPFNGYDSTTDMETELLIPAPFDEAYLLWMEAQIDYYNGEIEKYNAAITLFNTEFQSYESWYNANHTPTSTGKRFIF